MNPLRKLFIYSDNLTFEASGNLPHAVDRLSGSASARIVQVTLGSEPSSPCLVGSVSKEGVRLHKVTPLFGNFFKPIFFGKFEARDHKVSLVGKFEMGMIPQITTSIFVVVGIIVQIIALPQIGTVYEMRNLSFLEPSLFIAGVLLIAWSGKVSGKRDIPWIKNKIEGALKS